MKPLKSRPEIVAYEDVLARNCVRDVISGPEMCVCDQCKNFVQGREQIYPKRLMTMLDRLGIDYQKETELCYFNRVKPGWHFYKGWFHFVGQIQEAPDDAGDGIHMRVPDRESFAWSFRDKHDLVPKAFGQHPVVQLEWLAIVPWLLDAEEPL